MKTVKTDFLYGLHARLRDLMTQASIVPNIYPVAKSGERNNRCH